MAISSEIVCESNRNHIVGAILRSEESQNNVSPWGYWPSMEMAAVSVLPEHPCYDRVWGFEKQDVRWKESLAHSVEMNRRKIPRYGKGRKRICRSIDDVALRGYHAARMLQSYFRETFLVHFQDPLMETIYLQLSKGKGTDAALDTMEALCISFENPLAILSENSKGALICLVGKSRRGSKKPELLKDLIKAFVNRFPDGNTHIMKMWKEEEILDFLLSIPGIDLNSAYQIMNYSLGKTRFPIDNTVSRVLKRTQMLKELIIIRDDNSADDLQLHAEFAVPPSIRKALHTGIVQLGRSICRTGKPSCKKCPLSNICSYHKGRSIAAAENAKYTHVDLFCGAGGFSAGFSKEDFRTVLAVDNEPVACESFRLNHPEIPPKNVMCEDLAKRQVKTIVSKCSEWKDDIKKGQVDVLTAGIPCQGFSKAGYRSRPEIGYDPMKDPRNHLYKRVLLWIRDLQPRYVVLENVPEIRSAGNKDVRILDALCRALLKMGYSVDKGIVNAHDHGVPQTRHRMIIIASNSSVPPVKVSELEQFRKSGKVLIDAIGDLPGIKAGTGCWYLKNGNRVLTGHVARSTNDEDLRIFDALLPGEHYTDFIKRREDIIAAREKSGKYVVYGTRSFSDKYHRLEPQVPSRTIVAHLNKDGNGYIHPFQARSITPREAMRLQGFDDKYILCGSATKQYVQIGNAVPPPLSRNIARLLSMKLYEEKVE